ncbi:MAG: ROK family transcriptional regulator [Pseudomonadota bacterium]
MAPTITHQRDPEGVNQSGLRDHNARTILSLVRRYGGMSSAEIARRSGLSPQTVSIIVRDLEGEGLLVRGEAIRTKGKVGKPQTPMQLNASGVHSLGLNVGRRSSELVLVDFHGEQVQEYVVTYPYPTVDGVLKFLESAITKVEQTRPSAGWNLVGIGVTLPNEMWGWLEIVGAPKSALDQWKAGGFVEVVSRKTDLNVFQENDTTAACIAEHLLGEGKEYSDFGYFFVGAFVGGGLVLDDKIISGRNKSAASFGSMPITGINGNQTQLLNLASIYALEERLTDAGIDPDVIRETPNDWSVIESHAAAWAEETGAYLALASATVASVVEVQAILIDGAVPSSVRTAICSSASRHLAQMELDGIDKPLITEASVGRVARSIGAGLLPIHANYFLN